MLENYLRRMETNQEKTIKLLEGIGAELCLQRELHHGQGRCDYKKDSISCYGERCFFADGCKKITLQPPKQNVIAGKRAGES